MLKKIINYLLRKEIGCFSLGYGKHKGILIKLKHTPKEFWFSTEESPSCGCGQNILSAFGYKIVKNGVLFFCNIKTKTCKIKWKTKY